MYTREDFLDVVYTELVDDLDNNRANRIIEAADEYVESYVPDTNVGDIINRQKAIDAMCLSCGHDCDKSKFVYNAPQDEQVIMCPEHYALSTLPSVQLEIITCDECITPKRSECIWHNAGAIYCSFGER